MSKLDHIDITRFHGDGNLEQIFGVFGELDSNDETSIQEDSAVELKTTSIRLPVKLLSALDSSLSFHELTRQESFAFMVHDFISHSIVSYAVGLTKSGLHPELQDFIDACDSVIEKMSDDQDVRDYLHSIAEPRIQEIVRSF